RVEDCGAFSPESCDYPGIGARVARRVSLGKAERGLLLCKSGGGMAIVANKFHGVRAVVAQTAALARHAREHNDANVLVLGAEGLSAGKARKILLAWMGTPFAGGRHARRVRQIEKIEKELAR
ncbi:MAG: RpiB/LacA/LacB family sugar-phosphate isomerase, partial [Candidatus Omnitrophica bacterium]|nr:RpiB/LacA/LacB family sugar-phosphate isomerase [Candidatus Omnitrophota bacterium]